MGFLKIQNILGVKVKSLVFLFLLIFSTSIFAEGKPKSNHDEIESGLIFYLDQVQLSELKSQISVLKATKSDKEALVTISIDINDIDNRLSTIETIYDQYMANQNSRINDLSNRTTYYFEGLSIILILASALGAFFSISKAKNDAREAAVDTAVGAVNTWCTAEIPKRLKGIEDDFNVEFGKKSADLDKKIREAESLLAQAKSALDSAEVAKKGCEEAETNWKELISLQDKGTKSLTSLPNQKFKSPKLENNTKINSARIKELRNTKNSSNILDGKNK